MKSFDLWSATYGIVYPYVNYPYRRALFVRVTSPRHQVIDDGHRLFT